MGNVCKAVLYNRSYGYLIRLQLIIFLLEVRVNVTLSPCEGIGTLLKTLKHCFGMQAVSPETWLISPLNAFGEQEQIANTITVTFNMKITFCMIAGFNGYGTFVLKVGNSPIKYSWLDLKASKLSPFLLPSATISKAFCLPAL